ncbi:MAG: hypothetical protein R3C32_14085 [Chloroflexota bacterium]
MPSASAASARVWRLIAIAALGAAQLFDYVSFMVMVERHGLAAELNPIVVTLHQTVGMVGLTVVKAAAVVFLASTATLLMPRRPGVAFGVLVIGIILGVAGGVSNVMTL